MAKRKISDEKITQIRHYIAQRVSLSLSDRKIGEKIGVCSATVYRYRWAIENGREPNDYGNYLACKRGYSTHKKYLQCTPEEKALTRLPRGKRLEHRVVPNKISPSAPLDEIDVVDISPEDSKDIPYSCSVRVDELGL